MWIFYYYYFLNHIIKFNVKMCIWVLLRQVGFGFHVFCYFQNCLFSLIGPYLSVYPNVSPRGPKKWILGSGVGEVIMKTMKATLRSNIVILGTTLVYAGQIWSLMENYLIIGDKKSHERSYQECPKLGTAVLMHLFQG